MNLSQDYLRLRLRIQGAVQGVGYRPFVFRLATELGLVGWVNNSASGVVVEVEGPVRALESFRVRIAREKPRHAVVYSLESSYLDPIGHADFAIHSSAVGGARTTLVLPDLATCNECLRDIHDPMNRRYRYPFTNCTHCGPRFTIIEALPYDRARTTMRIFPMCADCQAEYDNPRDRRFHAQPNACPACGPHLALWDTEAALLATHDGALVLAADLLRHGVIIAVKGIGGFHLMTDSRHQTAVSALRKLKGREEKPFALMFPHLNAVREECFVSELEAQLLTSAQAPIVLLRRRAHSSIADAVAPGNPYFGVMLPNSPFHYLWMAELGIPIVATSGNLSEEPICIDENEAVRRLGKPGVVFLVHNRPIARHVDDSIVRVVAGRELVLRRARGYAPLPIHLHTSLPSLVAVGAHVKNAVAVSSGSEIFVSQHIGDLDTLPAYEAFQHVLHDFQALYELQPQAVACDMHPDYRSTQYAHHSRLLVTAVQHHYAHVLACMAENELEGEVLGVCWDGTGYGLDQTIWGGEFLRITDEGFTRVAHFRQFPLPGGEQAMREPRRSALGLLFAIFGEALFENVEASVVRSFASHEQLVLRQMLARGVNCPYTSSAGRLFDAVAALIGLRHRAQFEGQAALELECQVDESVADAYAVSIDESAIPIIFDWSSMIRAIITDIEKQTPLPTIAAKFHRTLVEAIVAVARRVGLQRIILTGGCFQNRFLTEQAVLRLRREDFRPYWHQRLPPNDGGIAVGQIMAAARQLRRDSNVLGGPRESAERAGR